MNDDTHAHSHAQTPADDAQAPSPTAEVGPHPHIRSFSGRRGHFTIGQKLAYDTRLPVWGVPYAPAPLDTAKVFGRSAPVVLEVGFGMGDSTAAIAAARRDTDFIGVEVYPAGVGSLLRLIDANDLTNLRIVQHDAIEVMRDMIAPGSLAGVHVFFPDPWPKARHHKRRIIRPAFVAQVASRLAPGGYLHCATDWAHYAEQMLAVMSAEPALRNTAQAYAPRPDYRPLTKFERRGMRLGHEVFDLVFERR